MLKETFWLWQIIMYKYEAIDGKNSPPTLDKMRIASCEEGEFWDY